MAHSQLVITCDTTALPLPGPTHLSCQEFRLRLGPSPLPTIVPPLFVFCLQHQNNKVKNRTFLFLVASVWLCPQCAGEWCCLLNDYWAVAPGWAGTTALPTGHASLRVSVCHVTDTTGHCSSHTFLFPTCSGSFPVLFLPSEHPRPDFWPISSGWSFKDQLGHVPAFSSVVPIFALLQYGLQYGYRISLSVPRPTHTWAAGLGRMRPEWSAHHCVLPRQHIAGEDMLVGRSHSR